MERGEGGIRRTPHGERRRGNQTSITEFILLGFGKLLELQIVFFLLFLMIYIVTISVNILIAALAVTDHCLHTPMHFLLGNLSCLEICYSSIILPRMLASFMTRDKTISVTDCIVQFFWFGILATAECYMLAVMSYDRYLAICKTLHYTTHMDGRLCMQLAAGFWLCSFISLSILVSCMSQLAFCGPNEIDHFFCDLISVINRSCSDTNMVIMATLILSSINVVLPFVLTMTSYIFIISTILRIPSTIGKQKAFSICSTHLIAVTIFYRTLITVHMLPNSNELTALNKEFSFFYTILTPLINPLIYSLRNRGQGGHEESSAEMGSFPMNPEKLTEMVINQLTSQKGSN